MSTPVPDLQFVADQCVTLVAQNFGKQLDFSVESLRELDDVCAELRSGGPLGEERHHLWWQLVGAYTGAVLVRQGWVWIAYDEAGGPFALSRDGNTAFPFGIADRVLQGEDFKTLASFGRVLATLQPDGLPRQ